MITPRKSRKDQFHLAADAPLQLGYLQLGLARVVVSLLSYP